MQSASNNGHIHSAPHHSTAAAAAAAAAAVSLAPPGAPHHPHPHHQPHHHPHAGHPPPHLDARYMDYAAAAAAAAANIHHHPHMQNPQGGTELHYANLTPVSGVQPHLDGGGGGKDIHYGGGGVASSDEDDGSMDVKPPSIGSERGGGRGHIKGGDQGAGKKTKGRVKIKMEFIDNKLRRYTTFSKRKTGIMKKVSYCYSSMFTFICFVFDTFLLYMESNSRENALK